MVDVLILESQIPSMAAVRALHFCPYDSSLIITCGQEDMKVSAAVFLCIFSCLFLAWRTLCQLVSI